MPKSEDLKVFFSSKDSRCDECREKLGKGQMIALATDRKVLCLSCADLDHLVYLPAGNAALTMRARKHSRLSAIVLKWSRARKRSERQGGRFDVSGERMPGGRRCPGSAAGPRSTAQGKAGPGVCEAVCRGRSRLISSMSRQNSEIDCGTCLPQIQRARGSLGSRQGYGCHGCAPGGCRLRTPCGNRLGRPSHERLGSLRCPPAYRRPDGFGFVEVATKKNLGK